MNRFTGVHHINLLVRDLDTAVLQYREQLGVEHFQYDALEGRGVRIARFRAGETWICLVQPVAEGEPMRVLREQGEGLFLLSLGVQSLADAVDQVRAGGGGLTSERPRTGLDGWQVIDLQPSLISGAPIQLTDDPAPGPESEGGSVP